jgi:hypothetical protein
VSGTGEFLLRALAVLLDPYLSDLGTMADRERIGTALRMLHAGHACPNSKRSPRPSALSPRHCLEDRQRGERSLMASGTGHNRE